MIRRARESKNDRGLEGSRRSVRASVPSGPRVVAALERKARRGLKLWNSRKVSLELGKGF